MEYPNVKNSHIVPRTYLEAWAVDGKIGVVQVQEKKRLELSVENVGTRRHFYRRKRPNGSEIDDIEWTLSEMESSAAPLLKSFAEAWPLSGDDKLKLATLFAFQPLRSPRWKETYEHRTLGFLEEYDRENPSDLSPQELEEHNAELVSDTHRLTQMISTGITTTSIFASMHWTLMEFARPLIATSDHPLVLWTGAGSRSPTASEIAQIGVLQCIEIRLPLSPTHAVLMTWSDHFDDEHVKARGTRDHAANLNAFTIASGERQWFHRPSTSPPRAIGNLLPLSTQLVPGYTPAAATNSKRRQLVSKAANKTIGRDLHDREIDVVTLSRPRRPASLLL